MKNPYKNVSTYLGSFSDDEVKKVILDRVSKIDYNSYISQIDRENARRKSFHDAANKTNEMKMLITADMIVENAYYLSNMAHSEYNILWIENNPDGEVNCVTNPDEQQILSTCLKVAFDDYPNISMFLQKNGFNDLYNKISNMYSKELNSTANYLNKPG